MNLEEAKRRVEAIRAIRGDDEYAHSAEDDLHRDFIRAVIAANLGEMSEVAAEVLKTEEIEFCRWCA